LRGGKKLRGMKDAGWVADNEPKVNETMLGYLTSLKNETSETKDVGDNGPSKRTGDGSKL